MRDNAMDMVRVSVLQCHKEEVHFFLLEHLKLILNI